VTSYNPKVTTISTVVDNSTWVEDVKNALIDTSANCNNFIQLIINPNFECGFNSNWDIFIAGGSSAAATFSDGTTDSRSGNVCGKIDVTAADNYNSVLLKNQEYTNDLTGKTLTVKAYVKASTVAQSFKFRIKAVVDGSNVFSVSPPINLSTDYPTSPFEFEYVVAANTTSIEVQTMLGNEVGIYYFDDLEFTIETTLSSDIIDLNNEVVLFPNPSQGFVNIKLVSLNKKIKRVRIIDVNGRVITEHNPKHTNSLKLNTNTLENGIYLIQITTSDNKVLRYKRIVVARQY